MKKRMTFSMLLVIAMFCQLTFGQNNNSGNYDVIKANFFKQYLQYKENLKFNPFTIKPVDPTGTFMIDANNNFTNLKEADEVKNQDYTSAPWINQEKDLASGYVWAQSSTTYTPIVGTVLGTATNDDNTFAAIPLTFSFVYDGIAYTTVDVNANGYIKFGTISGSNYPYILSLQTQIFAAINNDLRANGTTSTLQYLTTGAVGSRIFTLQWSNYGNYNLGWDGGDFSFQVKLYETSNVIQVVYGPFTTVVNSLGALMQSGINTTTADVNCRTTTTDWSATTAGGSSTAAMTFTNTIKPANGLTWSWNPPPTGQMGYLSSAVSQIQPGVPVTPGSLNTQIIKVAVSDTGVTTPISITNFKFLTTGSNNPGTDIVNAKLYSTGSTNTFSTSVQYGSTVSSPNGAFYFTGSTALVANATNYFWLTYDLAPGAVIGDSVDGQCDSITGTGVMGTVAPVPNAPPGSNPIDPYCLGQVSNAGCPFGLYIANVQFNTINNPSGCNGILPYVYTNYTSISTQIRRNNTYLMSITDQVNPNVTVYGVYIDWNNNNSFADAGEYYPTSIIPANVFVPSTANITVPPGAVLGNHRMRIRSALSNPPGAAGSCALLTYGEQEDYTVVVAADSNMTYTSSTTTQTNTSAVSTPSSNTQMIGMQVNVNGTISPMSATSFSLNTTGSTNPAVDITNAKLWYTGSSSTFATTNLVGTKASPNGAYTITGSQQLSSGVNYFWLTYDVPNTAVSSDLLDAECTSITIGGTPRIPTVTAPAGSRTISGVALSGIYTIPGSYATITAAVNDLNAKGVSGPVTFNVAAGYTETIANLVITATGTAANPITFKGSASLNSAVFPLITAGTGISTTTDGIIKISGGDYITFDGINLQEDAANVTTTTQMEWGYALVKPSGTDGCQYVTIKNCSITLNKTNPASVGIYSHNHPAAVTTVWPVTSSTGANSNNTFESDVITNAYIGIYINGFADVSPYSFYDQNNRVNLCNITNFGGTAATAYGIYNIYQNGLIINGNTINSAGGVNSTGTLYGMFCSTMNNSDLTISNNTVTIVAEGTTSTIYSINYGNGSAGTSNNINILNNTVQNSTFLTATSGAMYNIYCNAIANNITVSGNRIIGNIYGNAASTGTSVLSLYALSAPILSFTMTNNLDSGNVVNGTTAFSTYRMYSNITTQNAVITGNKVKNNIICGTTAANTCYGIYNAAGTFTCNMSNNEVSNNSLPTTGAQSMYSIYNFAPAPVMDYSNNFVTGTTSTGTGTLYGIYYGAAPPIGSTVNMNNNTVTNLSKTTATGTGGIYGIYQGSTPAGTLNINNNTVTGFSSAAATLMAGIYQASTPANYTNINNNKVGNFTNAGISTMYGIYSTATTTSQINMSQDSVFNLSSPGSTIYGMYFASSGMLWNIYKNSVSGITSGTSTTAIVYGMYSAIAVASSVNIYDNFVSDINAPASTSIVPAVSGIFLNSGAATTTYNLFYNTIYLKALSSSVTTFSTAGIYALSTPVVDMRNNVVVDNSTPGPTGGNSVAYRRSTATLTTYSANSNNNCLYAGTPSANHLLYFDGTNSDQTLAAYKTRVIPRDNVTITENPPFINGAAAPYDLRINTGIATGLESGGKVISTPVNIIDDKFSVARYPNAGYPVGGFPPIAPDMGANEFGGLNGDLTPPSISYTALGIGGTSNRPFNNVIITDASGVNTTAGTKPRCYYKRSTDGTSIIDNTSGTDGWKYVEANGTTSPFDFTIDYSLLFNGTGVVTGNTVQYFVVAQDLAGTPNLGQNQAIFTVAPTTVALAAANTPITSTLSYLINTNSFSGTVNVGTAQTYTSLTGAGGLFAALNAGTVTGNLTALITSDLTEDGSNQLNALNETGVGGYTLTIAPSSASMKTISGAVANGMIRLGGARRIIFDGNNGLGSKYLTFRNTNTSNPTITFLNEAGRDTIKNCIIESGNTSTGTTTAGAILFSTTTGQQGNDSIVINSCDIRDRTDATGYPAFAIYCNGTITTAQTFNSYNTVSNCNIYNFFLDAALFTGGIYLNAGATDWTITGNSLYQTIPRTVTLGATFGFIYNNNSTNNNNNQITNNFIGGSAPLCGGTAMTYTGTGTGLYNVYGIQAFVSVLSPTNITGNTIKNISLTASPTGAGISAFFKAIYAQTGWVNVNNNTIGSTTGNDNITLTTNTTTGSYVISILHHLGFGSVNGNTMGSITFSGTSTGIADNYYGINYSNTTAGQTYSINNNLIGSLTTANSIQQTKTVTGTAFRGILLANGAGTTNNITNNNIANITDFSTSTINTVSVYGVSNSGAGNYNFSGNTIRNLTNNGNVPSASFLLGGIFSTGTGINNYTQNNIFSLYALGSGAGAQLVGGILAGGSTGGTVARNKIFDFKHMGTGSLAPSPLLLGVNVQGTGQYTVSNNMVSLTNGDPASQFRYSDLIKSEGFVNNTVPVSEESPAPPFGLKDKEGFASDENIIEKPITSSDLDNVNDKNSGQSNVFNNKTDLKKGNETNELISTVNCSIAGVYSSSTSTGACNYYYNTFYIGGTQPSGSANSWAFVRTSTGALTLKNNLFINARSGGGFHFAIGNDNPIPATGWPVNTSNYNVYLCSDIGAVGEWGIGSNQSLSGWTSSSVSDKQTWSTSTSVIPPASLLTNVATCDLSVQTGNASAWLVSGKGTALTGQNIDFTGESRVTSISAGVTDIGADEFTGTPPSNPVATQTGTPGSGTSTQYSLWGRPVCTIDWGTGGTSYPTSVTVNYQSGVSPLAPNVTNPNRTSASYWTATPVGTFSGTTYDITWYYGDNETYTVTSPSTNVLLAKNDNTFWMTYPQGQGNLQSDLNPSLPSVKARGLLRFSSFTLSDAALPAEFPRTPLNNAVVASTSTTLIWSKSNIATTYRAQLATDSLFTTIVMNDSTLTDTTKLVSGLVNNQNYWWRVNGKNGTGTGGWSQVFKFTCVTVLPPAVVNLNVIPGGFYNTGTGRLNMRDTIRVYLVDSTSCLMVDSARGVLDSVNFGASISFSNANSGNYYMLVYHRNHLGVATRFRATVTRGATVGYDFTTDSAKCFGFNMVKVSTSPVRWGMIPGDANLDGFVDGLDQTIWIGQNGLDGYLSADFNGDSFIDGLDQTIWIIYNGNSSFQPCGFTLNPVTGQIMVNTSDYDAKKSNKMVFDRKRLETPVENNSKQNNNRK